MLIACSIQALAQQAGQYNGNNRFEQLGNILPTPNSYRAASGAPGKSYWQNRADYDIKAELNDQNQSMTASEVITYKNFSPDELGYLWVQLDQNNFKKGGIAQLSQTSTLTDKGTSFARLNSVAGVAPKEYGYKITAVKDKAGNALKYTINETMMRIDLPVPLKSGAAFSFSIDWNFNITDAIATRARSGYEYFPKDGNYLYELAQWFPRMCVYDDINGWQHKQFLGQGEFTVPFGDYKVSITAPNDFVILGTGELQNAAQVISATQAKRLEQAKTATRPVLIVTQDEAVAAEKAKPTGNKTWVFAAQNVRDFAFAGSRKFIWDAMQVNIEGKKVWAMSAYPKEANPLWGQYSTMLVAHTLRSYSKRTIAYTYPVAQSVHGPVGGMEYPMISFNGARPEADGTYSQGTKDFLIGVVIHEVGHNFFPMIVNSDERQWSWMDEGLNTFCEQLAEKEWDRNFDASGEPQDIVGYMRTDKSQQVPIMSSSDNIMGFGPNAYTKPATALNILRETVMGRELFDAAFKEYARRWAFKHPTPQDFFRTMEDASGVDLDWFWKGWFYGVEPVDLSLENVEWFGIDNVSPEKKAEKAKADDQAKRQTMSNIRNKTDIPKTVVEENPDMRDFYNSYDKYTTTEAEKKRFEQATAGLSDEEKGLVQGNKNFYVLNVKNVGGLPMPVIVKANYEDGTSEVFRYPAEIWRLNDKEIKKVIPTDKKVTKWTLDPFFEIADIDTKSNVFPREPEEPTRFQVFKQSRQAQSNPMQLQKQAQSGAIQGAKN
ncbi:M1 family metallopeptidase [Arcicella aquatica]|uniref:M1 family metallopeptidase n=2 Tax=Arcicella aquatica TaxID=217141 RepID=A0ABU5QKL5_9BACT|nr:M1 family metallopeptidase [Arcicella aquatica]MEA5257320.1 M1 family metallopeptidase [Arcicella aquatica]